MTNDEGEHVNLLAYQADQLPTLIPVLLLFCGA